MITLDVTIINPLSVCYIILLVYVLISITSNEKTFRQDFLEVLKRLFQIFLKMKKCVLVISNVHLNVSSFAVADHEQMIVYK